MGRLSRFIDETVYAISPQRGVSRMAARARREIVAKQREVAVARLEARRRQFAAGGGFASAEPSRDAHSWLTSRLSPDSALEEDRPTMIERADSAYKNHELGTAHVEGRVVRVAGTGMTIDPTLDHEELGISEEQAEEMNQALRKGWDRLVTRIGRRGEWLFQHEHLWQRYFERRGEFFILFGDRHDPLSPVSLKIDSIHPDRVSTPPAKSGDPTVRMGVQLNAGGEPIGYWVQDTHPGDTLDLKQTWSYFPKVLPNGLPRLLHVFEKVDEGQHRGYPRMQVGAKRLKNAAEYDEAELERNYVGSCLAAIVRTELAVDPMMDSHGVVEDSSGKRVRDIQPGMFHYVGESDDVETLNPAGAPQGFDKYMEHQGRMFACGAGTSLPVLTGDWRGIPYNGARIVWNQEDGTIDVLQMFHIIAMTAIWQHYVTRAITAGIIEVDAVAYRAEPWLWWSMRVIVPARPSIDPSREDRNELVNVESNVMPHSDFVERKTGERASTIYRRIERNRKELEKHGLEVHLPNMGRDELGEPGSNSPTQPGDRNQESSDANSEAVPA